MFAGIINYGGWPSGLLDGSTSGLPRFKVESVGHGRTARDALLIGMRMSLRRYLLFIIRMHRNPPAHLIMG